MGKLAQELGGQSQVKVAAKGKQASPLGKAAAKLTTPMTKAPRGHKAKGGCCGKC